MKTLFYNHFILLLIILSPAVSAKTTTDSTLYKDQYDHFKVNIGYTHWVSDSYRSAINGKEFAFGLGFRPGTPWLEIMVNHEFSRIRVDSVHPDYASRNDKRIRFTSLSLAPQKQFFHGSQSAVLSIQAGAVMVNIENEEPVFGVSMGFCFEYLFKVKFLDGRMGMIVDIRRNTYNISGESAGNNAFLKGNNKVSDRDVDVILGFVYRF